MKKIIFILVVFFLLTGGFFAGRFFPDSDKKELKTLESAKSEKSAVAIIEPQKKQVEKSAEPRYGEIRIKGKL